jgi:tRNA threonylcarbamoyl adenosine modification protein (Sua5/YciO/YrdC/YwlC family)
MIEYIIAQNPDNRILKKCADILSKGKLVCIPTDTNWVVVCDPFNKSAVESLYRLKGEDIHKHFSLLCADISMASELALIDNQAFKLIKKMSPGHFTFILNASKAITKYLKASKTDKEIGIRIPPNNVALKLIEQFGSALLSTNITALHMGLEEDYPIYSTLIDDHYTHQIAITVDTGEIEFIGSSTIIDFTQDGPPVVVREGAGNIEKFRSELSYSILQ